MECHDKGFERCSCVFLLKARISLGFCRLQEIPRFYILVGAKWHAGVNEGNLVSKLHSYN